MRLQTSAALAFSITSALAAPSQLRLPAKREPNPERAAAVKEAFNFSWNGYYEHAFPNDELHPVSNGAGNSRNGWGASAVDALTTAILMELPDVVDNILTHVTTIDFTTTSTEVSLFETTIRYLGGLLAGYDLLTGPFSSLDVNKTNIPILLDQAKILADTLKFAFNTESGIPYNNLWFTNQTVADTEPTNGLATVGTLVLEWTRLSDLLKDATYEDLTTKAESYLLDPKPATSEPFPGLVGSNINVTSGLFTDNSGGWSGGTDSFYEYLIKMYVYDPERFSTYKDRWVAAADSTIESLTSHPGPRPDITFVAEYSGQTLRLSSGHLTCFHGGNFILGGTVLGEQKYVDYGLELVNGCHNTYNSTATHIGPERFSWNPNSVPDDQKDFFDKNGFYIDTAYYDLRPEVIESYYYAYRVTGDSKYQDWAWDAFVAINATARVGSGFAAVNNVNTPGGGGFIDNQESFWFAEVMKYSYIIHADDAEWQVSKDGKNEWVYNTEAHPFKVFDASAEKLEAKQARTKPHSV